MVLRARLSSECEGPGGAALVEHGLAIRLSAAV